MAAAIRPRLRFLPTSLFDLDKIAIDTQSRRKETSHAGLALNVIEC
ncbi:MAG: hypothetical protein ACRD27_08815 [Terracidiphilus sp.]